MKNCLECDKKIVGREDKKFCSDACRNTYNNKRNKDSTNYMRTVNNKLRKNYRILVEINPDKTQITTLTNLLNKGFDFEFFTSVLQTKDGKIYNFIYDQGYMPLDSRKYIIVRKDI